MATNDFVIKNITRNKDNQLFLTIQNDNIFASFTVITDGKTINLPEQLELLLLDKTFDYHKEFLSVIWNWQKGVKINFPIKLSNRRKMQTA
jgi:hypothetical protein